MSQEHGITRAFTFRVKGAILLLQERILIMINSPIIQKAQKEAEAVQSFKKMVSEWKRKKSEARRKVEDKLMLKEFGLTEADLL